ncbi:hypothetical protein TS65_21750 [Aneurinibacillus migulanus]|uniref:Uncharacterized protein n=1 Tax=Aneurinibacillus migulanus TaxID=47500 RepID=A0A0D1Y0G5_ANEMI|nr:hypothetical protein [Aneurinibacillus migulanus]KIV52767.1 hypothetical protein TS65_21750 [Aneurinibacillus migulanus]KON95034.1 hypothetical protein AF333_05605 [Aneurinibacillus migulanus]
MSQTTIPMKSQLSTRKRTGSLLRYPLRRLLVAEHVSAEEKIVWLSKLVTAVEEFKQEKEKERQERQKHLERSE